MNCEVCQQPIPPERIEAVPETKRCVKCSDAGRVKGHIVYDQKTGGYVEVVKNEQRQKIIEAEQSIENRLSRL